MFKATVNMSGALSAIDGIPAEVIREVAKKVRKLTLDLQRHIVADKLQGQVLHHRSGALGRSIQTETNSSGATTTGDVFSAGDVKYAAIHEYGGVIPARDILPNKADALAFMVGGRQIFAKIVHMPAVNMPERSFMRSGLMDMAEEIVAGIRAAATAGANQSLGK